MDRIVILKQFIRDNPSDFFSRHALALECIKLGDDAEAERLFKEILENNPSYIGTYYHLGKLLERDNRADEALEIYENGIKHAEKENDNHALRELKAAFNQLKDEMDT
jgi:tetratricopeptide (TPR) repeat protein